MLKHLRDKTSKSTQAFLSLKRQGTENTTVKYVIQVKPLLLMGYYNLITYLIVIKP